MLITAGGKNIAPQEIEGKIQIHPLVSQVVVVGGRLPYLTALVTLDEEPTLRWGEDEGIQGELARVVSHEVTLEAIKSAIEASTAALRAPRRSRSSACSSATLIRRTTR